MWKFSILIGVQLDRCKMRGSSVRIHTAIDADIDAEKPSEAEVFHPKSSGNCCKIRTRDRWFRNQLQLLVYTLRIFWLTRVAQIEYARKRLSNFYFISSSCSWVYLFYSTSNNFQLSLIIIKSASKTISHYLDSWSSLVRDKAAAVERILQRSLLHLIYKQSTGTRTN